MPHRIDPPTAPAPLSAVATPPTSPSPAANDSHAPAGMSLRTLAVLLIVGSLLVSAALGTLIAAWLQPIAPWAVGLAAAAAVSLAAIPLGAAAFALARRVEALVPSAPVAEATATEAATEAAALEQGSGSALVGPAAHGAALSREMFMDMVAREWSRARRYGTGAALLLVEIDRYPRLTEALGVPAGEKVLAELLGATAPSLRGADALARYEAGRFAVFLAHADATGALDVAERIRERAEQMEVAVPPRRVRFTVSVGVAHLRPAHLYLQALIDDVVDALTAARGAGGNCVRAAPVDGGARPAPWAARDGFRADKK